MTNPTADPHPEISIIIPAFNEQAAVPPLFQELRSLLDSKKLTYEVVLVDDGSTPPLQVSQEGWPALRVLRHPINRGYGAAVKTGIVAAKGKHVVIMDADGQHDPADIDRFLALRDQADLIVGIRPSLISSPLWRWPGKWILTRFFNFITGQHLTDINCGFRCFKRETILGYLPLCSNRFSFSMSSTALMLAYGVPVAFVEIHPRARQGQSTVSVHTGLDTFILVIRLVVLTEPLRFFLPIALIAFITGLAWAAPYLAHGRGLSVGALFLMIGGFIIFCLGTLADQIAASIRLNLSK